MLLPPVDLRLERLAPLTRQPIPEPHRTQRTLQKAAFAREILLRAGAQGAGGCRPLLVAIDGAGGSGKTYLAQMLAGCLRSAAVVHTDDIAWHHSLFDWDGLLRENVIEPLHRGQGVEYRPPGWERKGRPGSIRVPTGVDLVIVEGTGSSRESLAALFDLAVWVCCASEKRRHRCLQRDGTSVENIRFFEEWDVQERDFLDWDRPWERATFIVHTDPTLPHDPDNEVVVQEMAVHRGRR